MRINPRIGILAAAFLAGAVMVAAQAPPASDTVVRSIHLNVAVMTKQGAPVAGLAQQDFTLLDNGTPEQITSFKAVTAGQGPVEVIVLLDAVNARFSTMAYERDEVQKFFKANGGKMAHPT